MTENSPMTDAVYREEPYRRELETRIAGIEPKRLAIPGAKAATPWSP